jgi:drug/metabolite transporter (DMT)-like permease
MFVMPHLAPDVLLGLTLAFLSMLAYASATLGVSIVLRGLSTGPGSLLSAAAGVPTGLVLVLGQLALGEKLEGPTWWAICAFALAGIFSTYLGRWLFFKSIELIGPSGASGLQSSSPLITAVLGWLFLHETLGAMGLAGMALGIIGLAGMSIGVQQARQRSGTAKAGGPLLRQRGFAINTFFFGLGAAAAYSGSHVMRAYGVRAWDQPLLGTTIGSLAGLLVLLAASRSRLPEYVKDIRANPGAARIYAGVGVMQFAGQALLIAAMKHIPASVAALLSMASPLVIMPISYFVLRKVERLTWATVMGVCVTLAGVALVVLYGPTGGH